MEEVCHWRLLSLRLNHHAPARLLSLICLQFKARVLSHHPCLLPPGFMAGIDSYPSRPASPNQIFLKPLFCIPTPSSQPTDPSRKKASIGYFKTPQFLKALISFYLPLATDPFQPLPLRLDSKADVHGGAHTTLPVQPLGLSLQLCCGLWVGTVKFVCILCSLPGLSSLISA